jgi:hypothetical protein
VRDRRNDNRQSGSRFTAAAGSLALRMWARAVHRPVDTLAILTAGFLSIAIVCNALFLQSGSHPAPFFANQMSQTATSTARHKLAEQLAARQPPHAIPARLSDPIADLIGPSPRILAVQRILAEFGYGQIKPSGILDDATSSAIEAFERGHKMPVTGQVSDRLVSELAAMTGQSAQ